MPLPTLIKLYDQPRAPNPMRLNVFLAEKGIDVPREVVNLMESQHKTPEYLAAVGAPICPAMVLSDGTVLTETQAICRYVEALYPDPNLMGHDPLEMAQIEMWQRRVEFGLWASVGACFRHTNPAMGVLEDQVPDWGEVNRGRINGHLETLDRRLEGRDWLAADRFTIADITGFLATGLNRIIKHEVPETLTNLAAWRARIKQRPSMAAIRS